VVPRDELIADWQQRLAAAEQTPPAGSARAQWLNRLRVRLYRFLLSLYSDGQWRESINRSSSTAAARVQTEHAVELTGKPAKDAAKIREALNVFAAARSDVGQPGPLLDGSGEDRWIVVAALSNGIQTERLSGMLDGRSIAHRLVHHAFDLTVEVRAWQATEVSRLIVANINQLRWFARPVVPTRPGLLEHLASLPAKCIAAIPPRLRFHLISAGQILLAFPLASLFAAVMPTLCPDNPDPLVRGSSYDEFYWTGLRGMMLIMLSLIWLRAHWQKRARSVFRALHPSIGAGR
jgi:hypothetical protein